MLSQRCQIAHIGSACQVVWTQSSPERDRFVANEHGCPLAAAVQRQSYCVMTVEGTILLLEPVLINPHLATTADVICSCSVTQSLRTSYGKRTTWDLR